MTDQIYYKVQYPLKKAIKTIKEIDPDSEESFELSPEEKKRLDEFLNDWDSGAEKDLERLITRLRKE